LNAERSGNDGFDLFLKDRVEVVNRIETERIGHRHGDGVVRGQDRQNFMVLGVVDRDVAHQGGVDLIDFQFADVRDADLDTDNFDDVVRVDVVLAQ